MKQLELHQVIQAPIDLVWAKITDHEKMVSWSPLKRVVLDKTGSPDRNGLGAIRRMMGAGPTILEEVKEWQPPDFYTYQLLAGAPIRDHLGKVELSQDGDETHIRWSIQFRPLVPGTGWLLVAVLNKTIARMLRRFQSQLERSTSETDAAS